jgi:hypothetical protein
LPTNIFWGGGGETDLKLRVVCSVSSLDIKPYKVRPVHNDAVPYFTRADTSTTLLQKPKNLHDLRLQYSL